MISQEDFEGWVEFMDETISQFLHDLPDEVSDKLDYSTESLSALEEWLMNEYSSPADILQPSENWTIDRASRYVGETLRRSAGGVWDIELSGPSAAFYGLPVIRKSGAWTECPASLVTASLDRREGEYIRSVVGNLSE
jgi:hypothetical protein